MKFGLLNVLALVSVIPLAVALNACSDDSSTSSPATKLPTEVKDLKELEEHKCDMSVIGEKVFVESEDLLYECDGDAWFKSYDQTKPSSTKSSSSKKTDGSSDSKTADKEGSSGNDKEEATSSSSAKSSSSRPTEILEPEITVNETCTEVGACDAMVKTDVSTWHFVRKDNFGDDVEYTYTVDGKDLIVTIKSADGSTDSKTYSMYNMESEAGVEMAFNAAKSTCKDGGGNDNKVKSCVKDTVMALPECDESREGLIEKKDSVSYVICKKGSWEDATETDVDTYGKKCTGTEVGTRTDGVVTKTNKYYCTSDGWISLMTWNWDLPKEAYLNPEFEYGSMTDSRDGQVYRTTTIGDQVWMAENLNYADSIATPSLLGKSWCFDNEEKKCNIAGRFYTWAAAIDSVKFATDENNPRNCGKGRKCDLSGTVQGICPNGWHLPSDGEFATLLKSVSKYGTLDAGYILKASPGGWTKNTKYLTDKFGFSALPVGIRSAVGDFLDGSSAEFLTTQEYNKDDVKIFELYFGSNAAEWSDGYKYYAYSVRCVKDSN